MTNEELLSLLKRINTELAEMRDREPVRYLRAIEAMSEYLQDHNEVVRAAAAAGSTRKIPS